jgi:hypothetical protein
MNEQAMLISVRDTLKAAVWAGSSNKVFGSVELSVSMVPEALRNLRVPAAVIKPGAFRSDPQFDEEPGLWTGDVVITIVVAVPGSHENPLIGGNIPDATKSEGQGILDIEEAVYSSVGKLPGISLQLRSKSAIMPVRDPGLGYVLSRDLNYEAICAQDSDASEIIRAPGSLEFGSTTLGTVRNKEFIPEPVLHPIIAEELGAYSDIIYCGETVMFRGVLRKFTEDAAAIFSPASGTFAFSTSDVGTALYANADELVFTPDASGHPTITLKKAIPAVDVAARIQLSLGAEAGLAFAFWGLPDGNGSVYTVT